jgi:hypothetical protein
MRSSTRWILAPFAAITLLVDPSRAGAQNVATTFDGLRPLVKTGDTVEVTGADGRKTTARVGALTESALTLSVRETDRDGRVKYVPKTTLSEKDVTAIRIVHHDSRWNGALIGLAIGAGPLLLVGPTTGNGGGCGSDFNVCPAVALFTGPIGMGIGAWIDGAHNRRTTVYNRGSSKVRVIPMLSKSVVGARVHLLL